MKIELNKQLDKEVCLTFHGGIFNGVSSTF